MYIASTIDMHFSYIVERCTMFIYEVYKMRKCKREYRHKCKCVICEAEFNASRPTVKTCSPECYGVNQTGANNPNFGVRWTDEQRKAASISTTDQYNKDPEYRYKVGKSNRGVKFSKERVEAMHGHRDFSSYSRPVSEKAKILIGIKSKEKFTDEYKERVRKVMEDKGYWLKLKDKDPYDIYYKEADWVGSMIEFFDQEALQNLKQYGMFGRGERSKGWVRDHILPRKLGYSLSLPCQLLRHPANLQFISHGANIAKGFADSRMSESEQLLVVDSLKERILGFTGDWVEHSWCVDYIKGT